MPPCPASDGDQERSILWVTSRTARWLPQSRGNTNVTHLPGHLLPSSGQIWHALCLNIRAVKSNVTQLTECQGTRSASISLPRPHQVVALKENLSQQPRLASSSTGVLLALGQPGIEAGWWVMLRLGLWDMARNWAICPRGPLGNGSG